MVQETCATGVVSGITQKVQKFRFYSHVIYFIYLFIWCRYIGPFACTVFYHETLSPEVRVSSEAAGHAQGRLAMLFICFMFLIFVLSQSLSKVQCT